MHTSSGSIHLRAVLRAWLVSAWLLGSANGASADETGAWEVEIDPAAYALRGYSLHVGRTSGRLRFDLGLYAADLPRWLSGAEGFDLAVRGLRLKVQVFLGDKPDSVFVGLGLGPTRERIEELASGVHAIRHTLGFGAEAGYRLELGEGFYISPWAGVELAARGSDLIVAGRAYPSRRVVPFATLHLGRRF